MTKASKQAKGKLADIDALYDSYEQASLKRQRTQTVLKASSMSIRQTVRQLLQKKDRVLLAAITKYYVDNYWAGSDKQKAYRQTRMRILTAVSTKNSGISVSKDNEGRVWLIKG